MALGIPAIIDLAGRLKSAQADGAQLSPEQQAALRIVQAVEQSRDAKQLVQMDAGFQFREIIFNLADLAALGAGGALPFRESGVEVIFSQYGSSPGALLQINAGGVLTKIGRGARLRQPFEGFTISAAEGCATTGFARFVVIKNPGYDYQEPYETDAGVRQTTLLGGTDSAGLLTFTSVNADTNPSGASPAGSFDVSGWKAIDVYLDSGADGRTFDLVCWFQPRGSTQWFQNQGAFQSFGTTTGLTTTLRTQQFTMGLFGEAGKLYFAPVNMSAGTAVGVHVKGVL